MAPIRKNWARLSYHRLLWWRYLGYSERGSEAPTVNVLHNLGYSEWGSEAPTVNVLHMADIEENPQRLKLMNQIREEDLEVFRITFLFKNIF